MIRVKNCLDPDQLASKKSLSSHHAIKEESIAIMCDRVYSKTCVKWPLPKRQKLGLQDQLSINEGQKYCRMLPLEHSAILLTFIKLPFVIKIFALSIFEWRFTQVLPYKLVCSLIPPCSDL